MKYLAEPTQTGFVTPAVGDSKVYIAYKLRVLLLYLDTESETDNSLDKFDITSVMFASKERKPQMKFT